MMTLPPVSSFECPRRAPFPMAPIGLLLTLLFTLLFTLLVTLLLTTAVSHADTVARPETPPPLLLRNVVIVPLDAESEATGAGAAHDVLIRDGKIAAIAPRGTLTIPTVEGGKVIDGGEAFLLPGLIDAHVHLRQAEQLDEALAWGLTTLRTMEGDDEMLAWRDEVAAGRRRGPTIVSSGSIIHRTADGSKRFVKVTTEDGARARVRHDRLAGFDLVKIAELDDGPFFALMGEARLLGITVAGHIPNYELDLGRVLAEGMASLEHLQEIWQLHQDQNEDASPETFAALFQRAGGTITPILGSEELNNRLFAEGRAFLGPELRAALIERGGEAAVERLEGAMGAIERGDWTRQPADLEQTFAVLRALHAHGVRLIAGTDSGGVLVPIGPGLHRELGFYVRAGLSPVAALRTATIDAAAALGLDDRGRVAEGLRADLVLVTADPRHDLAALGQIRGVVVAGRWLAAEDLPARRPAPVDAL